MIAATTGGQGFDREGFGGSQQEGAEPLNHVAQEGTTGAAIAAASESAHDPLPGAGREGTVVTQDQSDVHSSLMHVKSFPEQERQYIYNQLLAWVQQGREVTLTVVGNFVHSHLSQAEYADELVELLFSKLRNSNLSKIDEIATLLQEVLSLPPHVEDGGLTESRVEQEPEGMDGIAADSELITNPDRVSKMLDRFITSHSGEGVKEIVQLEAAITRKIARNFSEPLLVDGISQVQLHTLVLALVPLLQNQEIELMWRYRGGDRFQLLFKPANYQGQVPANFRAYESIPYSKEAEEAGQFANGVAAKYRAEKPRQKGFLRSLAGNLFQMSSSLAVGAIPGVGSALNTFLSLRSKMREYGRYSGLGLTDESFNWQDANIEMRNAENLLTIRHAQVVYDRENNQSTVYWERQLALARSGLSYDGQVNDLLTRMREAGVNIGRIDQATFASGIFLLLADEFWYNQLTSGIAGVPAHAELFAVQKDGNPVVNLAKLYRLLKLVAAQDKTAWISALGPKFVNALVQIKFPEEDQQVVEKLGREHTRLERLERRFLRGKVLHRRTTEDAAIAGARTGAIVGGAVGVDAIIGFFDSLRRLNQRVEERVEEARVRTGAVGEEERWGILFQEWIRAGIWYGVGFITYPLAALLAGNAQAESIINRDAAFVRTIKSFSVKWLERGLVATVAGLVGLGHEMREGKTVLESLRYMTQNMVYAISGGSLASALENSLQAFTGGRIQDLVAKLLVMEQRIAAAGGSDAILEMANAGGAGSATPATEPAHAPGKTAETMLREVSTHAVSVTDTSANNAQRPAELVPDLVAGKSLASARTARASTANTLDDVAETKLTEPSSPRDLSRTTTVTDDINSAVSQSSVVSTATKETKDVSEHLVGSTHQEGEALFRTYNHRGATVDDSVTLSVGRNDDAVKVTGAGIYNFPSDRDIFILPGAEGGIGGANIPQAEGHHAIDSVELVFSANGGNAVVDGLLVRNDAGEVRFVDITDVPISGGNAIYANIQAQIGDATCYLHFVPEGSTLRLAAITTGTIDVDDPNSLSNAGILQETAARDDLLSAMRAGGSVPAVATNLPTPAPTGAGVIGDRTQVEVARSVPVAFAEGTNSGTRNRQLVGFEVEIGGSKVRVFEDYHRGGAGVMNNFVHNGERVTAYMLYGDANGDGTFEVTGFRVVKADGTQEFLSLSGYTVDYAEDGRVLSVQSGASDVWHNDSIVASTGTAAATPAGSAAGSAAPQFAGLDVPADTSLTQSQQQTIKLDRTALDEWVDEAGKRSGGEEREGIRDAIGVVMGYLGADTRGQLDMDKVNEFRVRFGIRGQITQADIVRVATALSYSRTDLEAAMPGLDTLTAEKYAWVTQQHRPDLFSGRASAYAGADRGLLTELEERAATTSPGTTPSPISPPSGTSVADAVSPIDLGPTTPVFIPSGQLVNNNAGENFLEGVPLTTEIINSPHLSSGDVKDFSGEYFLWSTYGNQASMPAQIAMFVASQDGIDYIYDSGGHWVGFRTSSGETFWHTVTSEGEGRFVTEDGSRTISDGDIENAQSPSSLQALIDDTAGQGSEVVPPIIPEATQPPTPPAAGAEGGGVLEQTPTPQQGVEGESSIVDQINAAVTSTNDTTDDIITVSQFPSEQAELIKISNALQGNPNIIIQVSTYGTVDMVDGRLTFHPNNQDSINTFFSENSGFGGGGTPIVVAVTSVGRGEGEIDVFATAAEHQGIEFFVPLNENSIEEAYTMRQVDGRYEVHVPRLRTGDGWIALSGPSHRNIVLQQGDDPLVALNNLSQLASAILKENGNIAGLELHYQPSNIDALLDFLPRDTDNDNLFPFIDGGSGEYLQVTTVLGGNPVVFIYADELDTMPIRQLFLQNEVTVAGKIGILIDTSRLAASNRLQFVQNYVQEYDKQGGQRGVQFYYYEQVDGKDEVRVLPQEEIGENATAISTPVEEVTVTPVVQPTGVSEATAGAPLEQIETVLPTNPPTEPLQPTVMPTNPPTVEPTVPPTATASETPIPPSSTPVPTTPPPPIASETPVPPSSTPVPLTEVLPTAVQVTPTSATTATDILDTIIGAGDMETIVTPGQWASLATDPSEIINKLTENSSVTLRVDIGGSSEPDILIRAVGGVGYVSAVGDNDIPTELTGSGVHVLPENIIASLPSDLTVSRDSPSVTLSGETMLLGSNGNMWRSESGQYIFAGKYIEFDLDEPNHSNDILDNSGSRYYIRFDENNPGLLVLDGQENSFSGIATVDENGTFNVVGSGNSAGISLFNDGKILSRITVDGEMYTFPGPITLQSSPHIVRNGQDGTRVIINGLESYTIHYDLLEIFVPGNNQRIRGELEINGERYLVFLDPATRAVSVTDRIHGTMFQGNGGFIRLLDEDTGNFSLYDGAMKEIPSENWVSFNTGFVAMYDKQAYMLWDDTIVGFGVPEDFSSIDELVIPGVGTFIHDNDQLVLRPVDTDGLHRFLSSLDQFDASNSVPLIVDISSLGSDNHIIWDLLAKYENIPFAFTNDSGDSAFILKHAGENLQVQFPDGIENNPWVTLSENRINIDARVTNTEGLEMLSSLLLSDRSHPLTVVYNLENYASAINLAEIQVTRNLTIEVVAGNNTVELIRDGDDIVGVIDGAQITAENSYAEYEELFAGVDGIRIRRGPGGTAITQEQLDTFVGQTGIDPSKVTYENESGEFVPYNSGTGGGEPPELPSSGTNLAPLPETVSDRLATIAFLGEDRTRFQEYSIGGRVDIINQAVSALMVLLPDERDSDLEGRLNSFQVLTGSNATQMIHNSRGNSYATSIFGYEGDAYIVNGILVDPEEGMSSGLAVEEYTQAYEYDVVLRMMRANPDIFSGIGVTDEVSVMQSLSNGPLRVGYEALQIFAIVQANSSTGSYNSRYGFLLPNFSEQIERDGYYDYSSINGVMVNWRNTVAPFLPDELKVYVSDNLAFARALMNVESLYQIELALRKVDSGLSVFDFIGMQTDHSDSVANIDPVITSANYQDLLDTVNNANTSVASSPTLEPTLPPTPAATPDLLIATLANIPASGASTIRLEGQSDRVLAAITGQSTNDAEASELLDKLVGNPELVLWFRVGDKEFQLREVEGIFYVAPYGETTIADIEGILQSESTPSIVPIILPSTDLLDLIPAVVPDSQGNSTISLDGHTYISSDNNIWLEDNGVLYFQGKSFSDGSGHEIAVIINQENNDFEVWDTASGRNLSDDWRVSLSGQQITVEQSVSGEVPYALAYQIDSEGNAQAFIQEYRQNPQDQGNWADESKYFFAEDEQLPPLSTSEPPFVVKDQQYEGYELFVVDGHIYHRTGISTPLELLDKDLPTGYRIVHTPNSPIEKVIFSNDSGELFDNLSESSIGRSYLIEGRDFYVVGNEPYDTDFRKLVVDIRYTLDGDGNILLGENGKLFRLLPSGEVGVASSYVLRAGGDVVSKLDGNLFLGLRPFPSTETWKAGDEYIISYEGKFYVLNNDGGSYVITPTDPGNGAVEVIYHGDLYQLSPDGGDIEFISAASATPSPIPSEEPTSAQTPTNTPAPSAMFDPTKTDIPAATATNTPVPTATDTPTSTLSATNAPTATPSPTSTLPPTSTVTPEAGTATLTPNNTPTPTIEPTFTPVEEVNSRIENALTNATDPNKPVELSLNDFPMIRGAGGVVPIGIEDILRGNSNAVLNIEQVGTLRAGDSGQILFTPVDKDGLENFLAVMHTNSSGALPVVVVTNSDGSGADPIRIFDEVKDHPGVEFVYNDQSGDEVFRLQDVEGVTQVKIPSVIAGDPWLEINDQSITVPSGVTDIDHLSNFLQYYSSYTNSRLTMRFPISLAEDALSLRRDAISNQLKQVSVFSEDNITLHFGILDWSGKTGVSVIMPDELSPSEYVEYYNTFSDVIRDVDAIHFSNKWTEEQVGQFVLQTGINPVETYVLYGDPGLENRYLPQVPTVTPSPTTPSPTFPPTDIPTSTDTPEPSNTPTSTPNATSTPTAIASPTPILTNPPVNTVTSTATQTPSPTLTPTPNPTETLTPPPTATPSPTQTETLTPDPTVTLTPTDGPIVPPTPSLTPPPPDPVNSGVQASTGGEMLAAVNGDIPQVGSTTTGGSGNDNDFLPNVSRPLSTTDPYREPVGDTPDIPQSTTVPRALGESQINVPPTDAPTDAPTVVPATPLDPYDHSARHLDEVNGGDGEGTNSVQSGNSTDSNGSADERDDDFLSPPRPGPSNGRSPNYLTGELAGDSNNGLGGSQSANTSNSLLNVPYVVNTPEFAANNQVPAAQPGTMGTGSGTDEDAIENGQSNSVVAGLNTGVLDISRNHNNTTSRGNPGGNNIIDPGDEAINNVPNLEVSPDEPEFVTWVDGILPWQLSTDVTHNLDMPLEATRLVNALQMISYYAELGQSGVVAAGINMDNAVLILQAMKDHGLDWRSILYGSGDSAKLTQALSQQYNPNIRDTDLSNAIGCLRAITENPVTYESLYRAMRNPGDLATPSAFQSGVLFTGENHLPDYTDNVPSIHTKVNSIRDVRDMLDTLSEVLPTAPQNMGAMSADQLILNRSAVTWAAYSAIDEVLNGDEYAALREEFRLDGFTQAKALIIALPLVEEFGPAVLDLQVNDTSAGFSINVGDGDTLPDHALQANLAFSSIAYLWGNAQNRVVSDYGWDRSLFSNNGGLNEKGEMLALVFYAEYFNAYRVMQRRVGGFSDATISSMVSDTTSALNSGRLSGLLRIVSSLVEGDSLSRINEEVMQNTNLAGDFGVFYPTDEMGGFAKEILEGARNCPPEILYIWEYGGGYQVYFRPRGMSAALDKMRGNNYRGESYTEHLTHLRQRLNSTFLWEGLIGTSSDTLSSSTVGEDDGVTVNTQDARAQLSQHMDDLHVLSGEPNTLVATTDVQESYGTLNTVLTEWVNRAAGSERQSFAASVLRTYEYYMNHPDDLAALQQRLKIPHLNGQIFAALVVRANSLGLLPSSLTYNDWMSRGRLPQTIIRGNGRSAYTVDANNPYLDNAAIVPGLDSAIAKLSPDTGIDRALNLPAISAESVRLSTNNTSALNRYVNTVNDLDNGYLTLGKGADDIAYLNSFTALNLYEALENANVKVSSPVDLSSEEIYITSGFGSNNEIRNGDSHNGLDLAFPDHRFLEVYAATDGVVVFSGRLNDLGDTIIIRTAAPIGKATNADGVEVDLYGYTVYGHSLTDEMFVHNGDRVSAGTRITTAGAVGWPNKSTASHLHFAFVLAPEPEDGVTVIGGNLNWGSRTAHIDPVSLIDPLHGNQPLPAVEVEQLAQPRFSSLVGIPRIEDWIAEVGERNSPARQEIVDITGGLITQLNGDNSAETIQRISEIVGDHDGVVSASELVQAATILKAFGVNDIFRLTDEQLASIPQTISHNGGLFLSDGSSRYKGLAGLIERHATLPGSA